MPNSRRQVHIFCIKSACVLSEIYCAWRVYLEHIFAADPALQVIASKNVPSIIMYIFTIQRDELDIGQK